MYNIFLCSSQPTFSIGSVRGSQLPHYPTVAPIKKGEALLDRGKEVASISTMTGFSVSGNGGLCSWPARNSPVFAPLNAIMERCNDLLDLVQTVHDFRSVIHKNG